MTRKQVFAFTTDELTVRSTLPMTTEMSKYLNRLSEKCKDEKGQFMDRSVILRSLVRALTKLERQVDWKGIQNEDELVSRLVKAFKRN